MACHTQGTAFLSLGLWGWQAAADLNSLWPEGMGLKPTDLTQGAWQTRHTRECLSDYHGVLRAGRAFPDHLNPWFIHEKTATERDRACPSSPSKALILSKTLPLGQLPLASISVSQPGLITGVIWGTS